MLKVEYGTLIGYKASAIQDVLKLPSDVETIGVRALENLKCKKLVMSDELETIERCALLNADIKEISFGTSEVETIGENAFYGCSAKASLPDSVREIEAGAMPDLELGAGGKLKLPRELSFLANGAISLQGIDEVIMEESALPAKTNIIASLYGCLRENWVIVRAQKDGIDTLKFVLFNQEGSLEDFGLVLADENGLNFMAYDRMIASAKNEDCYLKAAIFRILFPIDLDWVRERQYKAYAWKKFHDLVIDKKDLNAISFYGEAGLISPKKMEWLLADARNRKDTVMVAKLMDLLYRKHGGESAMPLEL